ncbi:MAG: prolipoprotein diacylglyceryl transferase [Pseudobutyrivibrio sp.]|nr:prolipoprotein diacylglyceryl transferase [Pseudobutyrivibrio sp.]
MSNDSIIFPNLNITLEHVGKTIDVFGFTIAYYGIIIAIGMIIGVSFILHEAKRLGCKEDDYLDLCIYTLIFGVIGARLYYVIFAWDYYKDDLLSIINIRQGGLAIYGGILVGILTIVVVCKIKNLDLLETIDMVAFGVLIGQIMGRWGNFFNREVFGQYSDGLLAMQLPRYSVRTQLDVTQEMLDNLVVIDGVEFISVHPTFLYESLWNLALFALLFFLRKRKIFSGQLFFMYMIGYGVGRFIIEAVRTDQLKIGHTNIPVSMVVAAGMITAGVLLCVLEYRKQVVKAKVPVDQK